MVRADCVFVLGVDEEAVHVEETGADGWECIVAAFSLRELVRWGCWVGGETHEGSIAAIAVGLETFRWRNEERLK